MKKIRFTKLKKSPVKLHQSLQFLSVYDALVILILTIKISIDFR